VSFTKQTSNEGRKEGRKKERKKERKVSKSDKLSSIKMGRSDKSTHTFIEALVIIIHQNG
jgi:hypothetical protein